MKGRSLKLREAHRSTTVSVCSILWDGDGNHLVTAASSDPSISIHDQSQPSKPVTALHHHKDGVTSLALSPSSTSLASGSIDHSVKLYSFPDGEFQSNVTRFTLPIRCLAFNKSGSLLAAAGDDDGIKLIATIDSSISRVLKGHKGSVTGLVFDPKNEYLASVDGFGTVIFWELSTGKPLHTLKAVAPNCESDDSLLNVLGWSPDGETLAVPGLRNDVVMYDRDTAEKLFTLKGEHEKTICFLSWSPNGKYMVTSSLDKQVLIWDVDQRQDIDRQKFDDRICCLAWKPNGNALAIIDTTGKFGVWEPVVPSCMKSPTDGAPRLNANGCLLFDDDDEIKASVSGSLDDVVEESLGESFPTSRKRLRKQCHPDETSDGDDGEEGLLRQIESRKRTSTKHKENIGDGREDHATSKRSSGSKMQGAFQSGATPAQDGKRRFLAYNILGSITTIENEAYSHIEVDFHDTGRGPRVPSMTDHYGFTMASLNENGSIFANPCRGEKNVSTLMYRPFSSWANNSEWSMRFEGEEVKTVALGTGWVAAVTNHNFLRIFSEGGLQLHIICLNGPVVTATGYKDELAVVTHASDCLPSGDQILEVKVFSIVKKTQPVTCRLPLSPGSSLTWFGFSEEGQLSAYDSKGVLRVFSDLYGGTWLPLFSASNERKSEDENYWIVGLDTSKLYCIVCKPPESYPLVTPKPVLTLLDLSVPLASSDLGVGDIENEFIMNNLLFLQTRKKKEEAEASGLDTATLCDESFSMETALDRCIVKLIGNCCKGDKLVRAIELANLLSMEKSLKAAIRIATSMKLPLLAERFNGILEERLLNESRAAAAAAAVAPNMSTAYTANMQLTKSLPKPEIERTAVAPNMPTAHKTILQLPKSSPTPEIKRTAEPSTTVTSASLAQNHSSKHEEDNGSSKKGVGKEKPQLLKYPFAKASSNPDNTEDKAKDEANKEKELISKQQGETKEKQCTRPTNPFAKSSNNKDKSSLIDSIKKMRQASHEKDSKASNKKAKA